SRGVSSRESGCGYVKGLLIMPLPEVGHGEEAMAGRVIGALLPGLLVGVDGEVERRIAVYAAVQALEAFACKAAHVSARREEVNERSIAPRCSFHLGSSLERLTERDERHGVAGRLRVPCPRQLHGVSALACVECRHHVPEPAGIRLTLG